MTQMAPTELGGALRRWAAMVFVVLACGMICFQLSMAAGLPLGRFAWGGRSPPALPTSLRWASLAAAPVLALAAWVVLARSGKARPGPDAAWVRAAAWVLAALLTLNTLGNFMSHSPLERAVMTPISLVLAICAFAVAS